MGNLLRRLALNISAILLIIAESPLFSLAYAADTGIPSTSVYTVTNDQGTSYNCALVAGVGHYVIKRAGKYFSAKSEVKRLNGLLKGSSRAQRKSILSKVTKIKRVLKAAEAACLEGQPGSGASPTPTPQLPVSLNPLSRAVTVRDVYTLLDKAGFGYSSHEQHLADVGVNQGVAAMVQEFMATQDEAPTLLPRVLDRLDGQIGATTSQSPGGQRKAILDLWIHTNNPYAEKMAMTLLSIWTVSGDVIGDETFRGAFWDYYQRLRTYSYNETILPDLGVEISRDPLMLIYLNNELNLKGNPNENFARELMELFTLGPSDLDGKANYTETQPDGTGDIVVAAKMLTGWTVKLDYQTSKLAPQFVTARHESGSKTMFAGKPYAFSGDNDEDLVRGIFAHHPNAKYYYANEILKEYLTPNPPRELVEGFGQIIEQNNYHLRPAMAALFMSEAFYDDRFKNTVPLQPYLMIARAARQLKLDDAVNIDIVEYNATNLGFMPNQAPSVFWYPQDSWNSSSLIISKANLLAEMLSDTSAEAAASWTPATVLPVGKATNAEVIDYVRNKLTIPGVNSEQQQALVQYLSKNLQYDGSYADFVYDNTNTAHQRKKGIGLYYLLMLTHLYQLI